MNNTLTFFAPITKFDEELRMVYGIATNSGVDKQNEIVDWSATKEALDDYSNWRNIREMHKPSAVGIAPVLELRDDKQELFIGAKIVDEQAWQKVKEGVYKGFSIGGEVLDRKIEINKTTGKPINRVTKYIMNEISIVDRPANPACKFQTIKRDVSIETITLSEDPLKMESARVMEKALTLAKRVLSKVELENLDDEKFGLIKIVADGDKLVKHRLYPMPDKTHAINMIRKMSGCDELTDVEKMKIHTSALVVLGKSHNEVECPYCLKLKLEGGAQVSKETITKAGAVEIAAEPEKKVAVAPVEQKAENKAVPVETKAPIAPTAAPAETQKPKIVVNEDATTADVVPATAVAPATEVETTDQKLDKVIELLSQLVQLEVAEQGEEGKEEEVPATAEAAAEELTYEENADTKEKPCEEDAADGKKPWETDENVAEKEKPCDEACDPKEMPIEDEKDKVLEDAVKVQESAPITKAEVKLQPKFVSLKKMQAVIEPLVKRNKELEDRLAKLEKAPLPRKDATSGAKVKIEKFADTAKVQDVKLEKAETTYTDELQKDIAKAQDLRKSGKPLTSDESAFCQRVAEKMLDAKLSK